jgi:asparagine synthase (glutamine-hydrolysing)
MRGIVPSDVLNRREKIGFATHEKDLIIGMASTIRRWLKQDLQLPFFDRGVALQEFEDVLVGKRPFSTQIWRWVNFGRWHTMFSE